MESKNILDEYLDRKIKEENARLDSAKKENDVPKYRERFKRMVSNVFCCIVKVFKWIGLGLVFLVRDKSERITEARTTGVRAEYAEECPNGLEYALDLFFDFADSKPGRIVQILIAPAEEAAGYIAFDLEFVLDGPVEYHLNKETEDLFDLFKQVDDGPGWYNVQYTYNTYEKTRGRDHTRQKLQAYVRSYMSKHPNRTFDMTSFGAKKMLL